MKTKTNKLLTLLAVLAILAIPLESLIGQHLSNTATGIVRNAGVIRFIDDAGEFQNEADASTGVAYDAEAALSGTSGTIEFQGSGNQFTTTTGNDLGNIPDIDTETFRINGWVVYTSGVAQNVQGRFYKNLGMKNGGQKDFGSETVLVDHIYNVHKGGDASGTRNYDASLFYYDGDTGENQDIVDEDGNTADTDAYNELYFKNSGTKTLASATTANAVGLINIDEFAVVHIQGKMQALGTAKVASAISSDPALQGLLLLDGSGGNAQDGFFITEDGAGELDGDIYIYDAGTYLVGGTGVQTFSGYVHVGENQTATASSGSVTIEDAYYAIFDGNGNLGVLDLVSEDGAIVVGAGATAEFQGELGSFVNQVDYGTETRSNMQFAVTSIALYSKNAEVVGTQKAHPYGNLTINDATLGAANSLAPEGATGNNGIDVYVAGNFELDNRLLLMDNNNDPQDGSQVLVMMDETKTVTYPDDDDGETEEVVGAFRWEITSGYVEGTALTFNNRATTLAFNDDITGLEDFTLYTYPGNNATIDGTPAPSDYTAALDVKRRTRAEWSLTAPANNQWTAELQLGFLIDEQPTGYTGLTPEQLLNSLRFRKYIVGRPSKKLSTGFQVTRDITFNGANDNFSFASIEGITIDPTLTDAGDAAAIDDGTTYGDEIFLRGGPTWFITINHGRWSNPNTWDEGVQPGPFDLALVRHTVWAGYVSDIDDYEINEDVHLGTFGDYDESKLASYIQVYGGKVDDVDYDGALLFGGLGGGDAPNNDDGKAMENPNWGVNNSLVLTGFTSPFTNASNTQDQAVAEGNLYITALREAEVNVPTDYDTVNNSGYTTTVTGIIGGVINYLNSELTIPEVFTNHGLIVNGGVIILGQ